jgi:ubiquinone/menaquinone biosynthesis C-methylase UbiE
VNLCVQYPFDHNIICVIREIRCHFLGGTEMNEHDRGQVAANAAEIYEQFFVPALFAEWPPRVLEAAGVQQGDRVLDVACGTGILARKAAELVGTDTAHPNGSVIGIDINEGMLAVARQKAPDLTWKVGPAESLPFETDSFDRVVSQFGLMFFEDQTQAIAEMGRVVRPGGAIAVAVWDTLAATPGYAVVAEILNELFGPEVAKSIQAPYSLGETEKLAALFAEAGMNNAAIHTITGRVHFPSVEDWIYVDIKGWTLADIIDDEGYERLRQYAPKKLAQFVQPDGSVSFNAPAHIVVVSGN